MSANTPTRTQISNLKKKKSSEDGISAAPKNTPASRGQEDLDLAKFTVDELRKLGVDMGLSVGNCRKRSDLVDVIRAAGIPYMAASSTYPSKKSIARESGNVCNCCRAHNTGSSNDINVANVACHFGTLLRYSKMVA